MSILLADLRYGLRMLVAAPRVTLVAVLSLALGIGATTAIFTVIYAVILRPLPYPEADRLVMVWETAPDNNRRWVAPANFLDWRRDAQSFAQLAAYDRYSVNLTGRALPERLRAASVSGNFFSTLGAQPILGRTFTSAEDAPQAQPAVVLTYGLWQRLFGGASDVLGQTLTLDNRPHVIVGVLRRSFDLLGSDLEIVTSSDRSVPNTFPLPNRRHRDPRLPPDLRPRAVARWCRHRAGPGGNVAIMRRLEREYPQTNTGLSARVVGLHEDLVSDSRTALLLLLGAVGVPAADRMRANDAVRRRRTA